MKLLRRLAGLGYGSRREVQALLTRGRVRDADGQTCTRADDDQNGPYTIDGNPVDPFPPMVILLHKPTGLETTRSAQGAIVYDRLPPRFLLRKPLLAPVGRLDKDTSGLLLLTDDGTLLHRLTHPRHHVEKTYEVRTARPMQASTVETFAAGRLLLRGETTPLHPAHLERLGTHDARVTIREGRYHQVRRMFAAVGNHVETLHRSAVGPLTLHDLPVGAWRYLTALECRTLYERVKLPVPDAARP